MLKTLDVSNIRYSNESMFVKETSRGYQYFLRYSYCNAFYSTSRSDFARCLPAGVCVDTIAPNKHGCAPVVP